MDKNEIKKIRSKSGLNTTDFGKRIGKSGRTVENWEQGLRVPKPATVDLIKSVFGGDK